MKKIYFTLEEKKEGKRQTNRAYYLKNREKNLKTRLDWRKKNLEKRREYERFYTRKYREQEQEKLKLKARRKVANLVHRGKLQRGNCFCGLLGEAHHADYKKPLEIVWLCKKHHAKHHNTL